MKKLCVLFCLTILVSSSTNAQEIIPLDTTNWEIQANAYLFEKFKGQDAVYLQGGRIILKESEFLNGRISFDLYLKEEPSFPGVYFRVQEESQNSEQFYVRPHQSGNPDATQAIPTVRGVSPWQLYFGNRYSFPFEFNFEDWTHVEILVNDDKAQVFMNYAKTPSLSWNLFHKAKKGGIQFRGGNASGLHLANIKVSHEAPEIINFSPVKRKPIDGLIDQWQVSDKFEEALLERPDIYDSLIRSRKWVDKIEVEEGTAANISRALQLNDGKPGNTSFAKIEIQSEKDQLKLLDFGFSDRVVVILNGKPIYRGNNRWKSRDYRYLGTIGLFDSVYLNLIKGKNILLMAVSEDFGGWLITGKFQNPDGIKIRE